MVDPFTIGLILSGASGLFNAFGQNRAQQEQRRRSRMIEGQLQTGPGAAEELLLSWLTNGGQGFDVGNLFSGEGYNAGQDALMQMLNGNGFDTEKLFSSWEPIEKRALDQSLADSWAQASGLGQRFGSAMRREEGRVRRESAEGAAARREQASMDLYESGQQRSLNAAQLLQQGGLAEAATALQALMGFGQLGQGRQNANIQLLSLLSGQPATSGITPFAQFGGEFGQLMMLLPMLKQLNAGTN